MTSNVFRIGLLRTALQRFAVIATLGFFTLLQSFAATAGASPFINVADRINDLNLMPYLSRPSVRPITLAVFDLDFTGWDQELGLSLPVNTEYRPGPHPSELPASGHGLAMAQIAWAMASNGGAQARPIHIILYQTAGYSQFKWAVEDAIRENVDVVLYSQVWEFGSNFDGKGFLNVLVDRAVAAGISWINAAGNYGSLTYNGSVPSSSNGIDNVEMTCAPKTKKVSSGQPSPASSCALRMVLSWNDFADDPEVATDKDLDLDLVDLSGNVVSSSHLRQVGTVAAGETKSKYAREMIETNLAPGRYFAHVTVKSSNFTTHDKFRIVVSGNDVHMPDATLDDSVLPPADNLNALTASAGDSDIASWSTTSGKPDFWTISKIETSGHAIFLGSSNSAAMIAGATALVKSNWPEAALTAKNLTVRDLKLDDWKSLIDLNAVGRLPGEGPSSAVTGVTPNDGACFSERVTIADGRWLPGATPVDGSRTVQTWKENGAIWVNTSQGPKLFVAKDPVNYFNGMKRRSVDDAVVINTRSAEVALVPRTQVLVAERAGGVELMQVPKDALVCGHALHGWRSATTSEIKNGAHSPYFSLPPIAAFDEWLKSN